MNLFLLYLHIIGAVLLGGAVIFSIICIISDKSKFFLKFSYYLGVGLLFQAFTGTLIELTSTHPALFITFCSKILLYLAVVICTQAALAIKMKKITMNIPSKFILSYSLLTITMLIGTGFLLK